MKVYRIEKYPERFGVYQNFICYNEEKLDAQYTADKTRHPSPYNDSLFRENALEVCKGDWTPSYIFGFVSPEQLLHWFYNYEDLIRIENAGFQISVYECTDVIIGNTQCAFHYNQHNDHYMIEHYTPCQFIDKFSGVSPAASK